MAAKDRKQLTAGEWFGRAEEFWAASYTIAKAEPGLVVPNVVCGAFATEAYLKCLLTIREKRFPDDHNLHRLFNILPLDDKRAIEERWNEKSLPNLIRAANSPTSAPPEIVSALPKTLQQALKRGGDAFKDWRYSSGKVLAFMVGGFGRDVRNRIIEARPGWRDKPPNRAGKQSAGKQSKAPAQNIVSTRVRDLRTSAEPGWPASFRTTWEPTRSEES